MKHIKMGFFLVALSFLSASVASASFTYTITNNAVTITGHTNAVGDLEVPEMLEGYPVTSIGYAAFSGFNLTSITLPDTVTEIQGSAFLPCPNLTNISMSANLASIGSLAFNSCTSLRSLTIPASVTSIGLAAFGSCTTLGRVIFLGDYPSYVGVDVFQNPYPAIYRGFEKSGWGETWGDSGLSIHFWSEETDFLFSVTNNEASVVAHYNTMTDLIIPTYVGSYPVTSIEEYAFRNLSNLESLTISDSVTVIGNGAFYGCANISDVTMPSRFLSVVGDIFDPDVASYALLQGVAVDTKSHILTEKIYQPITSSSSSGSPIVIAPTSSVNHVTITGGDVSVDWDLGALDLMGSQRLGRLG